MREMHTCWGEAQTCKLESMILGGSEEAAAAAIWDRRREVETAETRFLLKQPNPKRVEQDSAVTESCTHLCGVAIFFLHWMRY